MQEVWTNARCNSRKPKLAKPHKQAQDETHCNTVIDAKAHHDGGHERLNQILAGKGDALGADPTLTRRPDARGIHRRFDLQLALQTLNHAP